MDKFTYTGWTVLDLVDLSGQPYQLWTRSTIKSDHSIDTSRLQGWIPDEHVRSPQQQP